MGMTDRQFDSYQSLLLDLLKEAYEEVKENGADSKKLKKLIDKIESELKRP